MTLGQLYPLYKLKMKFRPVLRSVRKQFSLEIQSLDKIPKIFVLLLIVAFFIVICLLGRHFIPGESWKEGFRDVAVGLCSEVIGAAAVYWVLDSSIQQLYGISELPELPLSDFVQDIHNARQIRMLETFTSLVTGDRHEKFSHALTTAVLTQGADVQILIIHPESDGAKQRADELIDILNVQDAIQKTLFRLYNIQTTLYQNGPIGEGKLTVKLYNASPSIAMHQWDSNAYVSFYPVGQRADKAPNLKISLKTTFGQFVKQKFDELWQDEHTILLKDHMLMTVLLEDRDTRYTYAVQIADRKPTAFYVSCNFGDRFGDFMKLRSTDQQPFSIIADGREQSAICYRTTEVNEKNIAVEKLQNKYGWDLEEVHKEINLDPVVYYVQVI